jgi:hypothetical protein
VVGKQFGYGAMFALLRGGRKQPRNYPGFSLIVTYDPRLYTSCVYHLSLGSFFLHAFSHFVLHPYDLACSRLSSSAASFVWIVRVKCSAVLLH